MSPLSDARKKANAKYNAKAYDRINIAAPKGRKAQLQEHTATTNESINAFINRAIVNEMERDKNKAQEDPT